MSNISQWNTSAASNNDAPPDGFPEGQAPSTVNDCAREVMAAVARQFGDTDGSIVTGGTSNAYDLTTNNGNAALADQGLIVFRADRANTGAATLNVDTLGDKNLQVNGAALDAGDLVADNLYAVAYNATNDTYDILNAQIGGLEAVNIDELTYNDVTKRLAALASGVVTLYSDGDTDTESRYFVLSHADGTSRGQFGYSGAATLLLRNFIQGGEFNLSTTATGGGSRPLINGDPDVGIDIYYPADSEINLQTVSHDAADNSSGANVRGADGTLRGIGYNTLPRIAVSGGNHTLAIGSQGMTLFYNEATARSILFNNDGNIPVDAYGHIRVGPSGGTLTLDAGTGVSLTYWNGETYTTHTAAANLEILDGSYTWWKDTDTSFYIDGPAITTA